MSRHEKEEEEKQKEGRNRLRGKFVFMISLSILNIDMITITIILTKCTAQMTMTSVRSSTPSLSLWLKVVIRHNSHQMYCSDENDPSAKLKTSKEELEAGEAVVDAQFWDLLDIGILHFHQRRTKIEN